MENEKIAKKIEGIILPYVEELNLSLVDVEYLQDGGYWYVRVYIEKLDSEISLEDCALLSGKIDDKLDNFIDKKFFLEVSSPGIERPLKKIEDFIRFKGEKIKVSLKHKMNDKKHFIGMLNDCVEETIYLLVEDEMLKIPFSEITKSNIVFDFDEV